MKYILFFYSLALALFISISGFLQTESKGNATFQLIFLPVVLYFLIKTFRMIQKRDNLGGNVGKSTMIFSFIVLVLLSAISVGQIFFKKTSSIVNPTPATSLQPSSSPQPVLPKIVIVIEDQSPSVNLREEPTIYSKIIKKALEGDTYELLEEITEWFKIKLEDGSEGYVSKKYARIEKQ